MKMTYIKILLIFVIITAFALIIKKISKREFDTNNYVDDKEFKNTISKMCDVLDLNLNLLEIFISMIKCIKNGSDKDLICQDFMRNSKLFLEENERNIIKYRDLEIKLLKIIDTLNFDEKEYTALNEACSAGAYCFEATREMFVIISMYNLLKDEKTLNSMIEKVLEIHEAHRVCQSLEKLS